MMETHFVYDALTTVNINSDGESPATIQQYAEAIDEFLEQRDWRRNLRASGKESDGESVHIFLSLHEFWDDGYLIIPEVKTLKLLGEVVEKLANHDYVPFVVLNINLADFSTGTNDHKESFRDKVRYMFETCMKNGALCDLGTCFWQDHAAFWTTKQPFVVIRTDVADKMGALAQIVDKTVMRQKVLVGLSIRLGLVERITKSVPLNRYVLETKQWPVEKVQEIKEEEFQCESEEVEGIEFPPSPASGEKVEYSQAEMSEMLEVRNVGQSRHWIRGSRDNSCQDGEVLCNNTKSCLRCNALLCEKKMRVRVESVAYSCFSSQSFQQRMDTSD